MRDYSYAGKWQKLLTPKIVSMLTAIHEFKGEQRLFVEAHKDELAELVDLAKIQSTEASNRIEGIYTSSERIKKLVLEKTTPHGRNESEIAGYRDVLNTIHESYEFIPVTPNYFLQLHRDMYKFSGSTDGGIFKTADNIIREIDSSGNERIRFVPVPAWETSEALNKLCEAYRDALQESCMADPLILHCMFILDFLCIHPFNDGNGRMSRLLSLLLLYKSGYIVGKYISLEKLIEESKETYYEALQESSAGWHENDNDYEPFTEYMLGVVIKAYREFESRVTIITNENLTKSDRVRELIHRNIGMITKTELINMCPDISSTTVQRTLSELVKEGTIKKIGGGRYTKYIWNEET